MAEAASIMFKNTFPDHHGERLLGENKKLVSGAAERIKEVIIRLLKQLESCIGQEEHSKRPDFSVYTGSSGYALLYLHLHKHLTSTSSDSDTDASSNSSRSEGEDYLMQALQHLKEALANPQGRRHTFLCGDAGPLALGAVVYSNMGDERNSAHCISRLEAMHINVIRDQTLPDEHLYGRCGYLTALLFVQHHLGADKVDRELIVKVTRAILDSGRAFGSKTREGPPLMYEWHNKKYLGAAHGLAGIMYTLLLIKEPEVLSEIESAVRPCVDFLLTLQFASGNFPSSIGSSSGDRLVQWCHGAPGWVYMFIAAYKTYNDKRYLEAAERCCEVTWQRGLLKKGYGLCHGAAGNAYAFLALFRLTRNQKHLYRAHKFAEWCCDYGKQQCRVPDRPFALFEGLAGTVYYLTDMLDPLSAKFPAFEF
ncbi:glutathione S-transferase LANCL1-like [Littorina saxatilis]|uniref:LanC-like protein 2 n=1 Tax=Littorina saxatilis TaxID=31220 RepID=A0AAN9GJK8_9CAEN